MEAPSEAEASYAQLVNLCVRNVWVELTLRWHNGSHLETYRINKSTVIEFFVCRTKKKVDVSMNLPKSFLPIG